MREYKRHAVRSCAFCDPESIPPKTESVTINNNWPGREGGDLDNNGTLTSSPQSVMARIFDASEGT